MSTTGDELKPDICIIGAGAAGLAVATAVAAFGVPVVLVERSFTERPDALAGNALTTAAARAHAVREARGFGITTGDIGVDAAGLRAHLRASTATAAVNAARGRLAALGVTLVEGEARFVNRRTVAVGERLIRARRFVIAVGAELAPPAIEGLDTIAPLTEDDIAELARIPARLAVLSDGMHGLETAQAMARLGSAVTLVCAGSLLPEEDPEAAGLLRRALLREGVALHENTMVTSARAVRGGAALVLRDGTSLDAGEVLVASGRRPRIARLDLDLAGISAGPDGISVDGGMRTQNRRIFAVGDCVAGMRRSTQAAQHQAGVVVRRALFRLPARTDMNGVPHAIACAPALARVGLTEAQARARGAITVLRFPFSENERARATHETEGLVKVVADRKERVVGVTIVGAQAGELIVPWGLAIRHGMRVRDMAGLGTPWPSFSAASQQVAVSSLAPLAARPSIRRLLAFLRRFG